MMRFTTLVFLLFLAASANSEAQSARSYLPISLTYLAPGGHLADTFGIKPGLGFNLGYQFALDRNWRVGAKGTWMWSPMSENENGDFSEYSATYYQILATVTWRAIKHGWTPYVTVEGGLGFLTLDVMVGNVPVAIDGASAVRGSAGGLVGVLIPLSDKLDVDMAGRYNYAFSENGYSVAGASVGVVYQLTQ
ncbi:MAG: outer membrane beta-barrel protein [Ignavibacteria bacterium]|nr:outer membrane beta-barrel protein [Ignavibacteria bacterium]